NNTASSLRLSVLSRPCAVVLISCLRQDGRGAAAGAGEDALPGMTQARCGDQGRGRRRGAKGHERDAAGQGRATEQQAAIAAFLPQHVVGGGGFLVFDRVLRRAMAG